MSSLYYVAALSELVHEARALLCLQANHTRQIMRVAEMYKRNHNALGRPTNRRIEHCYMRKHRRSRCYLAMRNRIAGAVKSSYKATMLASNRLCDLERQLLAARIACVEQEIKSNSSDSSDSSISSISSISSASSDSSAETQTVDDNFY
jgi:hypothetical protein